MSLTLRNNFLFILVLLLSFASPAVWAQSKTHYYEVLGVSKTASQEEIKKAYIEKAKEWHPDTKQTVEEKKIAEEKMQEINKAYETLKDPAKRNNYDQHGHSAASEFKGNGFADIFKDIFKEETVKKEKQLYSEKALFLFELIVTHKLADQSLSDMSAESALKELFKEVGIPELNKKASLQRILRDFQPSFEEQEIKEIREMILETLSRTDETRSSNSHSDPIHFSEVQKKLQTALHNFIENTEARYLVLEATSKERRAIEIFHRFSFFNQSPEGYIINRTKHLELLKKKLDSIELTKAEKGLLRNFERQETRDLAVFRRILSALGLPQPAHHDFLLKSYLDGLKESLFANSQNSETNKLLLEDRNRSSNANRSSYTTVYMTDQKILEALKNIKTSFDNLQYDNLARMKNPFSKNFLKSFPGQFVVFQAAIGASLFRKSMTEPLLYGAEKNPEMLTHTMKETITPTGALSFAIFVAVSQQVHYRLYGLGRFMDGKKLNTPAGKISFNGKWGRWAAPNVGLGVGFLVSSIFDELIRDPDLTKCTEQLFSSEEEGYGLEEHIGPCEAFRLNWISSDKWRHYTIDLGTLVGSAFLSHTLLNYMLSAIRLTTTGSQALIHAVKIVGTKVAFWIKFFMNMYMFMELHTVLDEWIGQPLKEQWTARNIKENLKQGISSLNFALFGKISNSPSEEMLGEISNTESQVKTLGQKFQHWINAKGRAYSQSVYLWNQQLNELILPYEGSSQLLKYMFLLSHFDHELEIDTKNSWSWDSDQTINNRDLWNRERGLKFESTELITKKDAFIQYCDKINETEFEQWSSFCKAPDEFSIWDEGQKSALVRETAHIIYNYLDSVLLRGSINSENFMSYLGKDFNEMFSSDPSYSIQNLHLNEKLQLSKLLIQKALFDNPISYFSPNENRNLRSSYCKNFFPENEELYNDCLQERKEACASMYPEHKTDSIQEKSYNLCLQPHTSKIEMKFLSAGIYLLRNLGNLQEMSPDVSNVLHSISNLTTFLLKSYKKGEEFFFFHRELEISHHLFLRNLICGEEDNRDRQIRSTHKEEEEEEFLFSTPQFFPIEGIYVYNFHSNNFEKLLKVCERFPSLSIKTKDKNFHDILFNRPVKMQGENYENLYLALENILKTSYSSSAELSESFQSVAQNQLDELRNKISNDLSSLMSNYYKSIVNHESEINQHSSLQDFLSYYHENNILLDVSPSGKFKMLEISLFQVNYWMNKLKQTMSIGESQKLNNENWGKFDKITFEKMQKEILSLLQSYHDSYKKEQGPYLLFPEVAFTQELDKAFENYGTQCFSNNFGENADRFSILQDKYQNSDLPILMNPDILLSHILNGSIPLWNNGFFVQAIINNYSLSNMPEWDQLIWSIVFQLKKSLDNFFIQFQALQMKEGFENQLSTPQTSGENYRLNCEEE